ncbi:hypothetical protein HN51_010129 [Arachis hypogaea]
MLLKIRTVPHFFQSLNFFFIIDEEENESVEEIDEDKGDDDDAVEVHEIEDNDDEDGVEYNGGGSVKQPVTTNNSNCDKQSRSPGLQRQSRHTNLEPCNSESSCDINSSSVVSSLHARHRLHDFSGCPPALEIVAVLGIELKFNSNCNGGSSNTPGS